MPYRNLLTIRNPANRTRHVHNHNIRPILSSPKEEYSFARRADLTKWLTSDEVRPYWLEFKRDCLSKVNLATLTTINSTTKTTNNVPRPQRPLPSLLLHRRNHLRTLLRLPQVERLLASQTAMKKLWRTAVDKRGWSFNCHVAWFRL